jgi:hypothetical protein
MKCNKGDCGGFVGNNWKCGLCEAEYCKECGESKAAAGTTTESHDCNPETASTFKALRKEAKPCPKCAALISKIDGCDQMWCTQCQTAFSWRTGQIETSHVHNPHYFQWMRQNGGAPAPEPRALGDCVNLTPQETLDQVVHYSTRRRTQNISNWVRTVRHYQSVLRDHQYPLRARQNDEWRRKLRVRRLINEIDDTAWKIALQKGEKVAQKEYAIVQILELFCQASVDILRNTLPEDADRNALVTQLEELRKYCNEELAKVERRFKNTVPYILFLSEPFNGRIILG